MGFTGFNMKKYFTLPVMLTLFLFAGGCVKMALKLTPSFIPNLSQAFFEECDPNLAKQSLPASLKLMEGLLKSDPENKSLLTTLCAGFAGYALLFIEEEDPEAASLLYLRARDYGLKALGVDTPLSTAFRKEDFTDWVKAVGKKDMEPLFWTTMAWNAWINLNLDSPAALGQLSMAKACLGRIMEIDPDYFYGAAHILNGTLLAAMPGPLGGDAKYAKENFERAMQLGKGRFFLAHYYFARYYAVTVQDKTLFQKLIKEVQDTPSDVIQDVCLINAVMKQKTNRLQDMEEDLFL